MRNGVPPFGELFAGDGIAFPAENVGRIPDFDVSVFVNVRNVYGCHLHGNVSEHGAVPAHNGNMGDKIAV